MTGVLTLPIPIPGGKWDIVWKWGVLYFLDARECAVFGTVNQHVQDLVRAHVPRLYQAPPALLNDMIRVYCNERRSQKRKRTGQRLRMRHSIGKKGKLCVRFAAEIRRYKTEFEGTLEIGMSPSGSGNWALVCCDKSGNARLSGKELVESTYIEVFAAVYGQIGSMIETLLENLATINAENMNMGDRRDPYE